MIKKYTPRTLFGRSLLIVIIPVVFLQIIIVTVFFNNHWDNVTRRLSLGIAGDIATIINLIERGNNSEEHIQEISRSYMGLKYTFIPDTKINRSVVRNKPVLNIPDKMLVKSIGEKIFKPYSIDTVNYGNQVKIEIQLSGGILKVLSNRKRVDSTSAIIFVFWILGTSLILILVAIIFLKNQLRPIKELSIVADKLGKGQQVDKIKPSGAVEIRQAMKAFMAMRDRIKRTVEKRTEMLAGVSHDLRTPITRMKLELAMLGKKVDVKNLESDVRSMEEMIDSYINFAKEQTLGKRIETNISQLINNIVLETANNGYDIKTNSELSKNYFVESKSLKRCILNLLENSIKYAPSTDDLKKVIIQITAYEKNNRLNIIIEDNGPGISDKKYSDAFSPFTRLDESKSLIKAGVGLGLTISKDIARSHGGDVNLSKSELGGLKATISLPI